MQLSELDFQRCVRLYNIMRLFYLRVERVAIGCQLIGLRTVLFLQPLNQHPSTQCYRPVRSYAQSVDYRNSHRGPYNDFLVGMSILTLPSSLIAKLLNSDNNESIRKRNSPTVTATSNDKITQGENSKIIKSVK